MKISNYILVALAFAVLAAFTSQNITSNYKCMIQLKNYTGEGAYVIVSILDSHEEYSETLYVQGEDKDWFNEISEWWKFYGKYRPNLDAITGATVSGGERTINLIKIPTDKIDAGYYLRFETAVEDQEYYTTDLQLELTTENLTQQREGSGFIRYVKMIAQ